MRVEETEGPAQQQACPGSVGTQCDQGGTHLETQAAVGAVLLAAAVLAAAALNGAGCSSAAGAGADSHSSTLPLPHTFQNSSK